MVRLRMAAVEAREREREVNAQLYGDLEERLGGLEDLRANGAGRYAVHRLHGHSARSWRAARHASLRGDGSYAASAVVFAVGTAATLVTGIVLQQRGVITIGAVLTLYRYADMLRRPLEQIAEQLKEFQKAMAGARRASTAAGDRARASPTAPTTGRPSPRARSRSTSTTSPSATTPTTPRPSPALRGVDLHLAGRAPTSGSSAARAAARPRSAACWPASGTCRPAAGRCASAARTCAPSPSTRSAAGSRS